MTNFRLETAEQIGHLIRAVRKANKVRLEDIAQLAGISKQTVQDIEHGKTTAQLGKVLILIRSLGVQMNFIVPPEKAARIADVVARLSQGTLEAHRTKRRRSTGA